MFAPPSQDHGPITASELKNSLIGWHSTSTVFFTDSFLLALQFAIWKASDGFKNFCITCVKASTARTAEGEEVEFLSIPRLIRKLNPGLRPNRDGTSREYTTEYITRSEVILGEGSCYVGFQELIDNGLYDLYPALKQANEHYHNLYRTMISLRQSLFAQGAQMLTTSDIDVAANLALSFRPILSRLTTSEETMSHLFAGILGLQKRDASDTALKRWVETNTNRNSVIRMERVEQDLDIAKEPEVAQHMALSGIMVGRRIDGNPRTMGKTAAQELIFEKFVASYDEDEQQQDEYISMRPERSESRRSYPRRRRGKGRGQRAVDNRAHDRRKRHEKPASQRPWHNDKVYKRGSKY